MESVVAVARGSADGGSRSNMIRSGSLQDVEYRGHSSTDATTAIVSIRGENRVAQGSGRLDEQAYLCSLWCHLPIERPELSVAV